MKKNFEFLFALSAIFLVISACRKEETFFSTVFENRSKKDIFLTFVQDSTSGFQPNQDTILLGPGESRIVFTRSVFGKTDQFKPCPIFFDSIQSLVANGSLTLNKSFLLPTNYSFNDLGKKNKVNQCECRLFIDSTDLQ